MPKASIALQVIAAIASCTLAVHPALSHADEKNISNIIVFGDSLSDSGNRPASAFAWKSPSLAQAHEGNIGGFSANFYVPVSNPVVQTGYSFTQDLAVQANNKVLKDIQNVAKALYVDGYVDYSAATAAQDLPPIAGYPREYASSAWPNYLAAYLHQLDKLANPTIIPSRYLTSPEDFMLGSGVNLDAPFSVNYAWSSSLSSEGCFTSNYELLAENCSTSLIERSVSNFHAVRENDVAEHESYGQHDDLLVIPGMISQVDLFLSDYSNKRVSTDNETAYFFYTGGNDLLKANREVFETSEFTEQELKQVARFYQKQAFSLANPGITNLSTEFATAGFSNKVKAFIGGLNALFVKLLDNHFTAVDKLVDQAGARHFYFINTSANSLNAFGNDMSPIQRTLADSIISVQNTLMKTRATGYNAMSFFKGRKSHIDILDMHQWIADLDKNDLLKTKAACQIEERDSSGAFIYNNPSASPDNCKGYLFWNDVHFSSVGHEFIALQVANQLL